MRLLVRTYAALVVSISLSAIACGGSEGKPAEAPSREGSPSTSDGGSPATPDDEPVKVVLLDPGTGDRRPLRYVFHVDRPEAMAMDMDMTMAMTLGARKMPPSKLPRVHMAMRMTPASTVANGDLVYRYAFTTSDVADSPDVAPEMIAALRAQLGKLVGLSGEVEVTTRGGTVHATMEAPPSLDANMRDVLDQIRSSLRDLSAPFPEEPVGVGAQWKSIAPFTMSGIHATRTVTYALDGLEGSRAKLRITVGVEAAKQTIDKRGLPEGAKLELTELRAKGRGTATVDLERLAPASDVALDLIAVTSLVSGSETVPITVATDLVMTITPSNAPAR